MMNEYYAHSKVQSDGTVTFETMDEHVQLVSDKARQFGMVFGAEAWSEILGHWHDIGKYSKEFQVYLRSATDADPHFAERTDKVDHSTAGAQHANNSNAGFNIETALAWCIAGHHAGLSNYSVSEQISSLKKRLDKQNIPDWSNAPQSTRERQVPSEYPKAVLNSVHHHYKSQTPEAKHRAAFVWGFFVRMIYSTLVDADFLATEAFMDAATSSQRHVKNHSVDDLLACLKVHLDRLTERQCEPTGNSEIIFSQRQAILSACIRASSMPPGLFTLTVPTGGGKTLASLRFALEHAANHPQHQFRRIIVGIPFTSIIEQTAEVYRNVFAPLGDDVVLEHHGNTNVDNETTFSRLASQNYDSSIVVTTNVQFLESLFSNKSSRARKIHRYAQSIIVLDEVQTLPVELLMPTLFALQELVDSYGCTIILSTATPPTLEFRKEFPIGLKGVREIIPKELELASHMKRVTLKDIGMISIEELVRFMKENHQFLCIHNTRKDAKETFLALSNAIPPQKLFHLSTFMCPAHRRNCLAQIRTRLADGLECKVVSTQLIEAGVDVDFPVVYRAIAGIDSITQAAGRCNREGRSLQGDMYLFRLPSPPPIGMLRHAAETTQSLTNLYPGDKLLSTQAVHEYFRMLYWQKSDSWDAKGILPMHMQIGQINFESIASAYRLIEDDTISVVVPYDRESRQFIKRLSGWKTGNKPLTLKEHRKIQHYSVSLFRDIVYRNLGNDFLEVCDGQFVVLANDSLYSKDTGVDLSKLGWIDPGQLVI
jgi:CRISPR-associated endonuclease/helicase Cas3